MSLIHTLAREREARQRELQALCDERLRAADIAEWKRRYHSCLVRYAVLPESVDEVPRFRFVNELADTQEFY